MNEDRARTILGDIIQLDNSLFLQSPWVKWVPGRTDISLDAGNFEADELEAITWWMRNKKREIIPLLR